MKTKFKLYSIACALLFSCTNKKQEVEIDENNVDTSSEVTKKVTKAIIDSTEIKLKDFMINDYLKEDIKFLTEADHQFQYENIDLNGDNIPETFIRFSSPYYCGSGGCTFLLLDNKQKIITKFTVMEAPIFVEKTIKNGWAILLVNDHGILKELVFNGKKYPSNPSVLPKATYNITSTTAKKLFEKPFADSKICTF